MDVNLLLFEEPSESPANNSDTEINNPFDECVWIANHNSEEDPFDKVFKKISQFDRSINNNLLINMNVSCESNNNLNLSNKSLNSSVNRSGNKSMVTPRNVKMAHKLVKSSPSPVVLKRDRMSSDSCILKMAQGKHLLQKLRDTGSLDNDTLMSVTKKTQEMCPSFTQANTSCDDLNSTIPKWVDYDLEQDDTFDIETLTIPFLKENENVNGSLNQLGSNTLNEPGTSGEHHTKLEMNTILANIKKSNENEEKQLFLRNLETSIGKFMNRFDVKKNRDKIINAVKTLIDLLDGKDFSVEDGIKSPKIIREETFELPTNTSESVKITELPSSINKPSRTSLNISGRESISHRSAGTTPKANVRASISHQPLSGSKKENRSPSINVVRRSLYVTPSKLVKPVIEVSTPRMRLRSKTHTLATSGPLKALEPSRNTIVPAKITVTSNTSPHHNPVTSNNTPIASKRLSTSRLATPTVTPIRKGNSKIATPSRLSKLHTPSRIKTTLNDFNNAT